MAEVYVTLGEAAELERVKYNTMVKRVLRKQRRRRGWWSPPDFVYVY